MSIKPIVNYILLVASIVLTTACSSDTFEIDVDLENLGTQNLRFVYASGDALQSMWIPAVDGKCVMHGRSVENTVVEIYNSKQRFVTCLVARNGDNIKLRGNFLKPHTISAQGNDVSEEVSEVVNAIADDFAAQKYDATDAAIEEYAAKKKSDALATDVLIRYYYSHQSDSHLLRLSQLRSTQSVLFNADGRSTIYAQPKTAKALASFLLYDERCDSITSFNPSNSTVSILYFWENDSTRAIALDSLKALRKSHPKKSRLQIADIGFFNDSTDWKKAIETDSVKWQQFWGIGGRLNSEVKRMGITSTPTFLVADSTGRLLYRGASLDTACVQVDSILKPKNK